MKTLPLSTLGSDFQKRFLILPKHGGLKLVSTLPEQEYLGLESLLEVISRMLPHRGGLTPMHYHKTPYIPKKEIDSLTQRMNENAIDKSCV